MWHVLVLASLLAVNAGCVDLRGFAGTWSGPRVGDDALRAGFPQESTAELIIDDIDLSGVSAQLTTSDGRFEGAVVEPLPAAEADVLGDMSFQGSPARVFLSFAESTDNAGPATVFVSLYNDDRIETRIMRGGQTPLYGVFVLSQ